MSNAEMARSQGAGVCGARLHRGAQDRHRRERHGRIHQVAAFASASHTREHSSQRLITQDRRCGEPAPQSLSVAQFIAVFNHSRAEDFPARGVLIDP
eukprot:169155-Pleurochrysis_carterae.AAC.4